jgi:hypothetical protein
MWKRGACFFLGWCLGLARADADMLASARRAQEMLGPGGWSEVLQIQRARQGFVPASVVYALVFELEDRLWFYEENSGTQSLSLWRDHLAADKAELGPLLRAIDPGFAHFEAIDPVPPPRPEFAGRAELPQGCFIDCVARLRAMIATGNPPEEARLLACYPDPAHGARGHTLLYFVRAGRRFCYDPGNGAQARPIPAAISADALTLARWSFPGGGLPPPQRAVFLALRVPSIDDINRAGRRLVASAPVDEKMASPRL